MAKRKSSAVPKPKEQKPAEVRDNLKQLASQLLIAISLFLTICIMAYSVRKTHPKVYKQEKIQPIHDTIMVYPNSKVEKKMRKKMRKITYERDSLQCRVNKLEFDSIKWIRE